MNSDITISSYDELEKRVINGKVENVTYHATNWAWNISGVKPPEKPRKGAKVTVYSAEELNNKLRRREQFKKFLRYLDQMEGAK